MAKPYIDLDLTGLPGVDPQRIVEELVRAGRDVVVCLEEQETRRQEISARERVALADLADRRELLLRYLRESFDERRTLFERLFQQADRAQEQRDGEAFRATMGALTELASSSPFRDLVSLDATRAALKRGESWEI